VSLNDWGKFNLNFTIMLNQILKIEGASLLSKNQQKSIKGGSSWCVFRMTYPSGSIAVFADDTGVGGSGASGAANSACVSSITSGNSTACQYDCEWDGLTADWAITPY
jgi:hypothetical protein